MTDKPPQPPQPPTPQAVFAPVYAQRPAAPEGDEQQNRVDAASRLPSRNPGLDQEQIAKLFEEALANSAVPDQVAALQKRVDELEALLEAVVIAPEPEPKPKTEETSETKPPRKTTKKGK